MPQLTIIVHTRDEEGQIRECLESCRHLGANVLVADMQSADRTLEIAKEFGATVVSLPFQSEFDRARNDSAECSDTEWILYLDADERITPSIARTIESLIDTCPPDVDAFQLPFKVVSFGGWIKHVSNWWPSYKSPPLLRRGQFTFPGPVHEPVIVVGRIVRVKPANNEDAILHLSHRSLDHYLDKLNRYTSLERQNLARDGVTGSWQRAALEFGRTFRSFYDGDGGRNDGLPGFLLSVGSAAYEVVTQLKLMEARDPPDLELPVTAAEFLNLAAAAAQNRGTVHLPSWMPQLTSLFAPRNGAYFSDRPVGPFTNRLDEDVSCIALVDTPNLGLEAQIRRRMVPGAFAIQRDEGVPPGDCSLLGIKLWHSLHVHEERWWFGWNDGLCSAELRADFHLHDHAFDVFGGGEVQALMTAAYLRKEGVCADICIGQAGRNRIKHYFSLHHGPPDLDYVISPIYWDRTELVWLKGELSSAFACAETTIELDSSIANIGTLRNRRCKEKPFCESLNAAETQLVSRALRVLPNAPSEQAVLEQSLGNPIQNCEIIWNAVTPFEADPAHFRALTGLTDFALCVGRIEWNKNQLLLVWSLRHLGIPLVLIGSEPDPSYAELCRSVAGPRTVFLGPMDHAIVQSAFAAATLHVLPSFGETPGLVNLEAAAQGCPILVSNRGAERDYFGDGALYCDPLDPDDIRSKVETAIAEGRNDRIEQMKRRVLAKFTWEESARSTKKVYKELTLGKK